MNQASKSFYSKETSQDEILKNYVKGISKIKDLTADEEKCYARLAKEGDLLAKQTLVNANLKLVVNIAKKTIMTSRLPLIDLIQEGNLGLIVAIDKFNHKLGYKFSTYATWWIKQAMFKAISEQSYSMRIPVYVQETLSRYKKAKTQLERKYHTQISKEDIARSINTSKDKIEEYLNAFTYAISLDSTIGSDNESDMTYSEIIEDTRENVEKNVEDNELRRDIETVLKKLKDKEQKVIQLRFGLNNNEPKTLQEIGKSFGVTKECIRQIEKRAINKLFLNDETQRLLSNYMA